jgi:helicase
MHTVQTIDPADAVLKTGFNAVLQMPTGSGKTTRAANRMGDDGLRNFKSIYLTPTKALASELFSTWSSTLTGRRIAIFTGDQAGEEVATSYAEAQVMVMTPEKLDLITRQWRNHWSWIPQVGSLVVDELHLLRDRNRGARLEGTILRWRSLNPFSQIIGLSATLGNATELADWLGGVAYRSTNRPIPLTWRTLTYRKAEEKPALVLDVVTSCLKDGGKSIVFVQSKRRAEQLSAFLQAAGLRALHHHAGLSRERRTQVENQFRHRELDALVATATLEVGMNLPARQVILYDLQQFEAGEFKPLSVISAWQRAGRAGRPGLDASAEVVLLRARWEKEIHYEQAAFEPIQSQLSTPESLSEQIVIAIAGRYARTRHELERHFSHSLSAHQKRLGSLGPHLASMIQAGFLVEREVSGRVEPHIFATKLGKACTRLMVEPEAIIKLRALLNHEINWTYFDLLVMVCLCGSGESLLSVDFEELGGLADLLAKNRSSLLQEQSVVLEHCRGRKLLSALKSAAALMIWSTEGDEGRVADLVCCYPSDVRQLVEVTTRTLSALGCLLGLPALDDEATALAERAPLTTLRLNPLRRKVRRLTMMVEKGLDPSEVTLTFVDGIGATWARRLSNAGITHLEELAISPIEELTSLGQISEDRAARWIQQAGTLMNTDEAIEDLESARFLEVVRHEITINLDVYRLKRSWSLSVEQPGESSDVLLVTGGSDPHRVVRSPDDTQDWRCDCLDHAKGNLCKHLLAVRRHHGDDEVISADAKLLNGSPSTQLDLASLWAR